MGPPLGGGGSLRVLVMTGVGSLLGLDPSCGGATVSPGWWHLVLPCLPGELRKPEGSASLPVWWGGNIRMGSPRGAECGAETESSAQVSSRSYVGCWAGRVGSVKGPGGLVDWGG
jgi:hypothetical protein